MTAVMSAKDLVDRLRSQSWERTRLGWVGNPAAPMCHEAADEIERLGSLRRSEAQRLDAVIAAIAVLWDAFGRDPNDLDGYVSDYGITAVIVDDFAPIVARLMAHVSSTSPETNDSREVAS